MRQKPASGCVRNAGVQGIVNILLVAIHLMTSPDYLWFIWALLGWRRWLPKGFQSSCPHEAPEYSEVAAAIATPRTPTIGASTDSSLRASLVCKCVDLAHLRWHQHPMHQFKRGIVGDVGTVGFRRTVNGLLAASVLALIAR